MPTVVVTDEMTIKYERKIRDESFNQVGIANPQGTLAGQKVWGVTVVEYCGMTARPLFILE